MMRQGITASGNRKNSKKKIKDENDDQIKKKM